MRAGPPPNEKIGWGAIVAFAMKGSTDMLVVDIVDARNVIVAYVCPRSLKVREYIIPVDCLIVRKRAYG